MDITDVINFLCAELTRPNSEGPSTKAYLDLSDRKLSGKAEFKAAYLEAVRGWLDVISTDEPLKLLVLTVERLRLADRPRAAGQHQERRLRGVVGVVRVAEHVKQDRLTAGPCRSTRVANAASADSPGPSRTGRAGGRRPAPTGGRRPRVVGSRRAPRIWRASRSASSGLSSGFGPGRVASVEIPGSAGSGRSLFQTSAFRTIWPRRFKEHRPGI